MSGLTLASLRGKSRQEQMALAAQFAGVNPQVLDGMWATESDRGRNMRSSAGAMGHFQIMPRERGVMSERLGFSIDPDNFEHSLLAAAHMLRENLNHFGNLPDALRAYNGGWDRSRWGNEETSAYVAKVLGADPGDGGEPVEPYTPRAPITSMQLLTTRPGDIEAMADEQETATRQARLRERYETTLESRSEFLDTLGGAALYRSPNTAMNDRATEELSENYQADVAAETFDGNISGMDKLTAAVRDNSLTVALMRGMERADQNRPFDPNFRYADHMERLEQGLSYDEIMRVREARSLDDAESILMWDIPQTRNDRATYGAGGAVESFLWGMAGGVGGDPVGFLAGLGAGKGLQTLGLGGRSLIQAGKPVSGVASIVAENAGVNLGITAGIDAAGEYVSPEEYLASGGFGSIMGAAQSPFALRSGVSDRALTVQAQGIVEANQARMTERLVEAQATLGPNATSSQIAQHLRDADAARFMREAEVALAPFADENRLFNADGSLTSEATGVKDRILEAFGLSTVSDDAERGLAIELYAKAEQFSAANPVRDDALGGVLQRVSPVDVLGQTSIGETMIRSQNPLLRMVGQVALESTTGRGGRRATVAMGQALRERVYMGRLGEVENYYRLYARDNGYGLTDDLTRQTGRRAFNRAVTEELLNRGREDYVPAPLPIQRAADIYSEGYHRMAIDQQVAGTVGAARITPDASYFPQRLSAVKVLDLTNAQRKAVISAISEQVQARYQWDKEFADGVFAPKYIERALDRASGAYDVPINLNAPDAGDIIDDILDLLAEKASGKKLAQIEEMRGKFSRGGASHTKARTEFDMFKEYLNEDGSTFKLLDLFETDQSLLYRSYARRASGEAALAQAGIPGAKGLKTIRKSLQIGARDGQRVTDKELAAFDQFATEILNQPFGGFAKKTTSKHLDNARLLTSMARLGGMAITQFAETGNAIAPLGVHRAFAVIKDLPKLMGQVGKMRNGKPVNDPILSSLEQGYGGDIGMDDFHNFSAFDVVDNDVHLYGKENINVLDRAIRAGANGHAVISGHRHMVAAQTRGMAREIGMKALRFIREGKEDKALADMGFTPELREAIKRNLDSIATFNKHGRLETLDIHAGDLTPAQRRDIIQTINRGAGQIIQRTYTGETGPWAHDGFLKLLFQFRTFGLTAAEKQFSRALNMGGAYAFMTLMAGFSFALPIYMARVHLASIGMSEQEREEYLEQRLTPAAMGRGGMMMASTFGFMSDATDIGGGLVSGLGVATGLQPQEGGGRYGTYDKSLLGGTIAPSVGLVEDMWKGVHGDWRKLGKSLPGANLPYIIPLINALEAEE